MSDYKWIKDVNDVVQGLGKKMNNLETRKDVLTEVMNILNENKVDARIDCGSMVNTREVVSNGGFVVHIDTKEIMFVFNFIREESK